MIQFEKECSRGSHLSDDKGYIVQILTPRLEANMIGPTRYMGVRNGIHLYTKVRTTIGIDRSGPDATWHVYNGIGAQGWKAQSYRLPCHGMTWYLDIPCDSVKRIGGGRRCINNSYCVREKLQVFLWDRRSERDRASISF
jgi:hypothetical protein